MFEQQVVELYHQNYSARIIAQKLNTYTNKVIRTLRKLGYEPRSKSEAQKIALESGRHKHPTKGKKRSEEVKAKISEAGAKHWDNLSDEEREARAQQAKDRWDNMSDIDKLKLREASSKAILRTTKEGSKLEKFVWDVLIRNDYQYEPHKAYMLQNQKLNIDILVPELGVAIEVDGPAHFENCWGEDALAKQKMADQQKNGLIMAMGLRIIRIAQRKGYVSAKNRRDLETNLVALLKDLDNRNEKVIYLEVN